MDSTILRIVAKRKNGAATANEVITWAETALNRGLDSPSLRILAGLESPPNEFEVDLYFQRSLDELKFPKEDKEFYLLSYLKILASDLITEKVDLRAGSDSLYRLACSCEHELLVMWQIIPDDFDLADEGYKSDAEVRERVMEDARNLLSKIEERLAKQ